MVNFYLDVKIGRAPPAKFPERLHFAVALFALQDKFEIDIGHLLLCVHAAAVHVADGVHFRKPFRGREAHLAMFGRRGQHPVCDVLQRAQGIFFQVLVQQGNVGKRRRGGERMHGVGNQPGHEGRFINRRLNVPAGEHRNFAHSHSRLSIRGGGLAEHFDAISFIIHRALCFHLVSHQVDLRLTGDDVSHGPACQFTARFERLHNFIEHHPSLAFISKCGPPEATAINSL